MDTLTLISIGVLNLTDTGRMKSVRQYLVDYWGFPVGRLKEEQKELLLLWENYLALTEEDCGKYDYLVQSIKQILKRGGACHYDLIHYTRFLFRTSVLQKRSLEDAILHDSQIQL